MPNASAARNGRSDNNRTVGEAKPSGSGPYGRLAIIVPAVLHASASGCSFAHERRRTKLVGPISMISVTPPDSPANTTLVTSHPLVASSGSDAARQLRLPANPPGARVVQARREADRGPRPNRFKEGAEYAQQVTSTDHLRMHRKDEDAVPCDVAQEVQLGGPGLDDRRGRPQAGIEHAWGFNAHEIGMIIEMPAHRQLDKRDWRAPAKSFFLGRKIIDATPVRLNVVAHKRAVVLEPLFEEKPDCGLAVVPARGAIAQRPDTEHTIERLQAAHQHVFFLFGGEAPQRFVDPAVVTDLVALGDDRANGVREGNRG